MTRAIDGFKGGVKIHGMQTNNLRFEDNIVLIGSSQRELKELIERLDGMSARTRMEISAAKSKLLVVRNASEDIQLSITVSSETLEQVSHFKYLNSIVYQNGKSKWAFI